MDANRAELSHLEEAVAEQLNTGKQPKKRRKKTAGKTKKAALTSQSPAAPSFDTSILEGISNEINLDDIDFDLSDDSDE
jgi:hypothetical protein